MDYASITSKLRGLLTRIRDNNEEFKDLAFSLDDEQAFLRAEALSSDISLYVVVQYGQASTSLGSCVLSVTFTALGLPDELSTARDFLAKFATEYNLKSIDGMILNVNTPSISANFTEGGSGYRSLVSMMGLLITSEGSASFGSVTYFDDDGTELDVPILNFQDQTQNSLAPQVYGNTYGRTKSYAISQTYTFTITTYSLNNALIKKVNKIKYENASNENATFKFSFALSNGQGFTEWEFRLSNATYTHSVGNIDGISLTFTL